MRGSRVGRLAFIGKLVRGRLMVSFSFMAKISGRISLGGIPEGQQKKGIIDEVLRLCPWSCTQGPNDGRSTVDHISVNFAVMGERFMLIFSCELPLGVGLGDWRRPDTMTSRLPNPVFMR
jgi:hypothetical protein